MAKKCTLNMERTKSLVSWSTDLRKDLTDDFAFGQALSTKIGAHLVDGSVEIGFWAPEIREESIPLDQVYLEILIPLKEIFFDKEEQQVQFKRFLFNPTYANDCLWFVLDNVPVGTRDKVGAFYWIKYIAKDGEWSYIRDPLAYSVPFGVFAPAEIYDIQTMQDLRSDKSYFENLKGVGKRNGLVKLGPPTNILQIHPNTASPEGSLEGLTKIYGTISKKLENNEALLPFEQNYIGYDAIQLMPIEPIVEYENGDGFWETLNDHDPLSDQVLVDLKKPNMTNWGYDIVIAAMSATNPTVLASKRPDELIDFIATLHNFSAGPIRIIFDVVYGHSDNQGLGILNHHFFTGPNMYGQDMNFQHPMVRSIMLEMQRRKGNVGIDALRVDGAQDFKYWDSEQNTLLHDDLYLQSMSDVTQTVSGVTYYPWMIFEDGRPWPRQDWELASSYRSVIEKQSEIFQWGPLTFAHNTPFLYTFWTTRWWRVREIMEIGSNWVTGCSNHDTVRRGTQVDPEAMINDKLGDSLPEILDNGYDNPSEKILTYGMFPGQPMDFINAAMRAPWSFIRNTDDTYGVKVVSEEKRFLDWQVSEDNYKDDRHFRRLKHIGFSRRAGLYQFMHTLESAVDLTHYDLEKMSDIMNSMELDGPTLTKEVLKAIAKDWMDDVHDYCNVGHYLNKQDPVRSQFNLDVRQFRRARPWLMGNLGKDDYYDYLHPTQGTVLYFGLRNNPDQTEQVLFIANMEGIPLKLVPVELPIPNLEKEGWQMVISAPGMGQIDAKDSTTFSNSDGVIFTRNV